MSGYVVLVHSDDAPVTADELGPFAQPIAARGPDRCEQRVLGSIGVVSSLLTIL